MRRRKAEESPAKSECPSLLEAMDSIPAGDSIDFNQPRLNLAPPQQGGITRILARHCALLSEPWQQFLQRPL